jgi:hypothetical protein
MQVKKDVQVPKALSHGELVIFRRHMAFRLFIGLWALHSIIHDPLNMAFVALMVLGCFYAMGETIFASYMGYARLKARWDEEQKRREESLRAREAKAATQAAARAAAAAEYFDLEKSGSSAPKPRGAA